MKLLLFDIDQTLVSTGGAGIHALDRACKKLLAIDHAMDGIRPHGKTDPAIAREILRVRLGATSDVEAQIQSILEAYLSFLEEEVQTSAKYRVLRLVHYEHHRNPYAAISREKEIKGWSRERKMDLVSKENPAWDDLAANWFDRNDMKA